MNTRYYFARLKECTSRAGFWAPALLFTGLGTWAIFLCSAIYFLHGVIGIAGLACLLITILYFIL